MTTQQQQAEKVENAARQFRLNWIKSIKPDHPLYNSPEAKAARGEPED